MIYKIKFLLALIVLYFVSQRLQAQDVIVKKDGITILSKVLEVNEANLKYKKFKNPQGPTYSISLSEIMSVNYENGEKDVFDEFKKHTTGSEVNSIAVSKPSEKNNSIISKYNKLYSVNGLFSGGKTAKKVFFSLGVSNTSIMANDDLEITFNNQMNYSRNGAEEALKGDKYENCEDGDLPWNVAFANPRYITYQIIIKNRTDRILYVDLSNCFRVYNKHTSKSYYDASQYTVANSNSSRLGLGVGSIANVLGINGVVGTLANGISVGTNTSNVTSTTFINERILSIPPHSFKILSEPKWIKVHGANLTSHGKYKNVGGHYESLPANILNSTRRLKEGETVVFDENNSPFTQRYIITYSLDPNFKQYSMVDINQYLRQIIGVSKYSLDQINGVNEYTVGGIVKY